MTRVTGSVSLLAVIAGSVAIALMSTSSGDAQSTTPSPPTFVVGTLDGLQVPEPVASEPIAPRAVPPERIPAVDDSEQKTRAALHQPVTVTFKDVPTSTALRTLEEEAGVTIRLGSILAQEEVDLSQPVSGEFQDVALVTAVEQLLSSLPDLSYKGGSMLTLYSVGNMTLELNVREDLVAPYGMSRHLKKTFIYPIADICDDHADAEELMEVLRTSCGRFWLEKTPEGLHGVRMLGQLMTIRDDNDFHPLIQGADTMRYLNSVRGLVITAKTGTHDDILNMLRMVREAHRAAQLVD